METKGLIHVSAPDLPEAGRRILPLERGPVAMRGVRDPMGGPEPRLLVLECLSPLGQVASPDLPRPWIGSGLLSEGQDFGPQAVWL